MTDGPRGMERHIQTALAAILIGLVGWVGITVSGNREQIGRIDERLFFMTQTISELKSELGSRSSNISEIPHMLNELEALENRAAQMEDRFTNVSSRIRSLEEFRDRLEEGPR